MITIISGTNRKNAMTKVITDITCGMMKEKGIEYQLLDLRELPDGLFHKDVYWNAPPEFKPFQEMVLNCDGILIVTPEYNGSFPGVLKYFIDILKFPESLLEMPTAFIGVADGYFGALRSIEQLSMILQYRKAHLFGKKVMFPNVSKKLSEDKTQITDDKLRAMLEELVVDFNDFANRLKK